jgi:hypothetical protein
MQTKILILATPRSWGTIFQDNVRNDSTVRMLSFGQPYHKFVSNGVLPYTDFATGTHAITTFLDMLQLSFVCKIEPYQIYHIPSSQLLDLDRLNLRMYSKIYVLDRTNRKDRLASVLWAQHTQKWHYYKDQPVEQPSPLALEVQDWRLKNIAREHSVLEMFCKYLDNRMIMYERIYTETLASQYSNANSFAKTRPSSLNYSSIILNLDELYTRFEKFYKSFLS